MPDKTRLRLFTVLKYGAAAVAAITPIVTLIVTFGPLPEQVREVQSQLREVRTIVDRMDAGLRARGFLSDSGEHREKLADASPVHRAE